MALEAPPPQIFGLVPQWYWQQWIQALNFALRGIDAQPTSWWRSLADNVRVGGASNSQHLVGLAVDFVFPRNQRTLAKQRLRQVGFVVIDEGDHVHVQTFEAGGLERTGLLEMVKQLQQPQTGFF